MNPLPVWLQRPFESLISQLESDRLSHALLIDGQAGWGGELLADAFALVSLASDGNARDLAHPDLMWVEPDGSSIKIDQIRLVIEFLQGTVQLGGRKIAVIPQAELMTMQAQNALLKMLEEPPSGNHIVLVSTNTPQLLPTVRSRCQRVLVPTDSEQVVREWLNEKGCQSELVDSLMYEYSCAPFLILEAIEEERVAFREHLSSVWRKPHETLELVSDLRKEDFDDLLVRWLRLTSRYAINQPAPKVTEFWDDLIAMRRANDETAGLNTQLQLERLLIKWSRIRRTSQSRA